MTSGLTRAVVVIGQLVGERERERGETVICKRLEDIGEIERDSIIGF